MVGLKSVWVVLFSLLLVGACVPQKKQTECGSSEAFNSQLRACVPIVQGPSAFINISSFSPLYTSTRFKNDSNPVTFTIAVSNPYNQSFTIEWELNYNGAVQTIAGNVLTTSAFIPVLYSSNVGSNVITAKIISGGNVVDSHNFEVVLQDNPRPNINSASVSPADYNPVLFPDNTGTQFSFTGRNNGATGIGNYRVFWTLSKNGVNLPAYAETDTFAVTSTNGTNIFMYGANNGTNHLFKPTDVALGVGSYVLRTRMQDTISGDVVDERAWNITVRDPEFGFVSSAGNPLPSVDTIAFFGISYDDYTFNNSTPTPSRFCVTVSDPDGSYANGTTSDPTNLNMVVRFYKDNSGTPIYEGRTVGAPAVVDDTVCFDDASDAVEDTLVFADGSPTTPHYRALTARVFDEQTGREICGSGNPTCPIAYPISWSILVKPLDTGVTGTFQTAQAGDNITYTSSGASTRTATVTQNQAVRVRFLPSDGIIGYEGYDMRQSGAANSTFFQYDVVIKKSGVTIATLPCKTPAAAFPFVGVTNIQSCTFTWPAFDPVTNAHLDPGAYVATLQVTDSGSPVPGSIGTVSNALTINATVSEPVNAPEFNPAPDILNAAGSATILSANEGETIRFRIRVEDDEHDDYTLLIQACGTNATCAAGSLSPISSDSRIFGDTLYAENTTITYTIPEDILGSTLTGTLYFKVTLTDSPTDSTKSSSRVLTPNLSITVNNANAAPVYNAAAVTPTTGATYDVFAGYQFTGQLNGALTDASTDTDERPNMYQWWIGSANDLNDPTVWTAIQGATESTLRWTPGPELSTTARFIAVCYSDGFPRTSATSAFAPDLDGDVNQRCQSLWQITPRTNSALLTTLASVNGEVAIHNVPSERVSYVAYASNNVINVEKVEYRTDGTLGTPMAAVSFTALPGGATADNLKNLSITASDSSLYVAYLADATPVPGNSFRAYMRRFNISNLAGQGGSKVATTFTGTTGMGRKFGFSYTAVPVTVDCSSAATNCIYDSVARTITFNGAAVDASSDDNITINGLALDFAPSATKVVTEICSDCNANGQAQSLADAINAHPSTLIQGLTAAAVGTVVTLYGMEVDGTEIYTGTQTITSAGKILYNTDNNRWYWPMANADLAGNQNKIQILHGANNIANAPVTTNVMSTLDDVSAIDNAWSIDSPLQMYMGYIRLSGGTPKVNKFTINGSNDLVAGTPRTILPAGSGVVEIQLSPPTGADNPNVFVTTKDNTDNFWMTRLPAALGSQLSYKIEEFGADAGNTSILDMDNVSRIYVTPARPALAGGTTDEGRLVVVSKSTGSEHLSYLFRWKTIASLPVLEATTTFDLNLEETSSTSKLAGFAPTSITLGSGGSITAGNTNSTMGVVRVRADGEVEFNLLNTEVESINSTTNSATGLFRPPYVK